MRITLVLLILASACTYDGSVGLTLPPLEPGHLEARWAVTLGGGFAYAERVVHGSDGSVVVAGQAIDGEATIGTFVAKRAGSDGSAVWSVLLERQTLAGLATTADGGVAIATIRWDDTLGARGWTVLSRFDASGTILWSRDLRSWNDVGITQLVAHGEAIYVAGTYRDTIDVGGGLVTNLEPEAPDDSFLLRTGDAFVARLDESGVPVWGQTFAGPGGQRVAHLAIADDDDIVFTAYSSGGSATFGGVTVSPVPYHGIALVRLAPAGQLRWAMELPPFHGGNTNASALAIDATGRVVSAGHEHVPDGGGYVTTRIVGEGAPLQVHANPHSSIEPQAITPEGMVVATGESSSGMDLRIFDVHGEMRGGSSFFAQGGPMVPSHALAFHDVAVAEHLVLVAGRLDYIADFGTGPVRSQHSRTYPDGSPMSSGPDGLVVAFDWVTD